MYEPVYSDQMDDDDDEEEPTKPLAKPLVVSRMINCNITFSEQDKDWLSYGFGVAGTHRI